MTEGVTSAQAHFALQPETFPLCQGPHPRGGCLHSRLGEFRQIPPQAHYVRQLPQGDAFALCRKLSRHHQKPSPWTDSPRPGRDVALATEWGAGGIAAGDDGRGSPASNPLSLLTAFAARFPLLSPTVTSSPGAGEVYPLRGSFWHLPASMNKAPPSGELASRSDD